MEATREVTRSTIHNQYTPGSVRESSCMQWSLQRSTSANARPASDVGESSDEASYMSNMSNGKYKDPSKILSVAFGSPTSSHHGAESPEVVEQTLFKLLQSHDTAQINSAMHELKESNIHPHNDAKCKCGTCNIGETAMSWCEQATEENSHEEQILDCVDSVHASSHETKASLASTCERPDSVPFEAGFTKSSGQMLIDLMTFGLLSSAILMSWGAGTKMYQSNGAQVDGGWVWHRPELLSRL